MADYIVRATAAGAAIRAFAQPARRLIAAFPAYIVVFRFCHKNILPVSWDFTFSIITQLASLCIFFYNRECENIG